nr:MAG TPA_asm: hypothetical protein [Caudoviricetes sp.]
MRIKVRGYEGIVLEPMMAQKLNLRMLPPKKLR